MNNKLKAFLIIIIIVVILVLVPLVMQYVKNVAINFGIRTFLILLCIYLILEVFKYLKK